MVDRNRFKQRFELHLPPRHTFEACYLGYLAEQDSCLSSPWEKQQQAGNLFGMQSSSTHDKFKESETTEQPVEPLLLWRLEILIWKRKLATPSIYRHCSPRKEPEIPSCSWIAPTPTFNTAFHFLCKKPNWIKWAEFYYGMTHKVGCTTALNEEGKKRGSFNSSTGMAATAT